MVENIENMAMKMQYDFFMVKSNAALSFAETTLYQPGKGQAA